MRTLLVDASVFITLAEIGHVDLLGGLDGRVVLPEAVADEVRDDPAARALAEARTAWLSVESIIADEDVAADHERAVPRAAARLGRENAPEEWQGDVALLALALRKRGENDPVVITDDKPLRTACKSLGISLSGSIGVLVASVERDDIDPEEAKRALLTMDEVGAHLSVGLLRRAERLVDEAAGTEDDGRR